MNLRHGGRLDSLGIDGNENLAPPHARAGCAQRLERIEKNVPAHCRVLENRNAQPGQRVRRKGVCISGRVLIPRSRIFVRKERLKVRARLRKRLRGRPDGLLIALEQLTIGAIEFKAVVIGRNMATGHHDRSNAALERVGRERRRRHSAGVDRFPAQRRERAADQRGDLGTGRSQVTADHDLSAARIGASGFNKAPDMGKDHIGGKTVRKPPQTGGSETHRR